MKYNSSKAAYAFKILCSFIRTRRVLMWRQGYLSIVTQWEEQEIKLIMTLSNASPEIPASSSRHCIRRYCKTSLIWSGSDLMMIQMECQSRRGYFTQPFSHQSLILCNNNTSRAFFYTVACINFRRKTCNKGSFWIQRILHREWQHETKSYFFFALNKMDSI